MNDFYDFALRSTTPMLTYRLSSGSWQIFFSISSVSWARKLQCRTICQERSQDRLEARRPQTAPGIRWRNGDQSIRTAAQGTSNAGGRSLAVIKMGQRNIRTLFTIGAMTRIVGALKNGAPKGSWLGQMLERKTPAYHSDHIGQQDGPHHMGNDDQSTGLPRSAGYSIRCSQRPAECEMDFEQ